MLPEIQVGEGFKSVDFSHNLGVFSPHLNKIKMKSCNCGLGIYAFLLNSYSNLAVILYIYIHILRFYLSWILFHILFGNQCLVVTTVHTS